MERVMKKNIISIMAFMLLLALTSPSYAEKGKFSISELYDQYNGYHWQGDYETKRKETVHVDITLAVPETEAIGVFEAKWMDYPEGLPYEEGTQSKDGNHFSGTLGEEYYVVSPGAFDTGWPCDELWFQLEAEAKAQGRWPSLKGFEKMEAIHTKIPYGTYDLDTAYSTHVDRTVRDGWNLVNEAMSRFYPGRDIQFVPHWLGSRTEPGEYKKDKKSPIGWTKVRDLEMDMGEMYLIFDQLLDGVPVVTPIPYNAGNVYGTNVKYINYFDAFFKNKSRFHLLQKTKTIKENVALCDPNTVLKAAEELIQSGRLRKVYSMRLGYWSRKDGEGKFTLLPVWAIEGELFKNAKAETALKYTPFSLDTLEDRTIVFDAHTGELLKTIDDFPIY